MRERPARREPRSSGELVGADLATEAGRHHLGRESSRGARRGSCRQFAGSGGLLSRRRMVSASQLALSRGLCSVGRPSLDAGRRSRGEAPSWDTVGDGGVCDRDGGGRDCPKRRIPPVVGGLWGTLLIWALALSCALSLALVRPIGAPRQGMDASDRSARRPGLAGPLWTARRHPVVGCVPKVRHTRLNPGWDLALFGACPSGTALRATRSAYVRAIPNLMCAR